MNAQEPASKAAHERLRVAHLGLGELLLFDAKRQVLFDAQPDEVRRRCEANANREGGRFTFDQVFRVNLLHKIARG